MRVEAIQFLKVPCNAWYIATCLRRTSIMESLVVVTENISEQGLQGSSLRQNRDLVEII